MAGALTGRYEHVVGRDGEDRPRVVPVVQVTVYIDTEHQLAVEVPWTPS